VVAGGGANWGTCCAAQAYQQAAWLSARQVDFRAYPCDIENGGVSQSLEGD